VSEQPKISMERHIQTVLAALIIGLVGWVGVSVTTISSNQAALSVQVTRLESDVSRLTNKIEGGILPRTQSSLDNLQAQIDRHEKQFNTIWPRLREMKERVQALEPKGAPRWQY